MELPWHSCRQEPSSPSFGAMATPRFGSRGTIQRCCPPPLQLIPSLLQLIGNNQQYLNGDRLSILTGRPELPLLQRVQHECSTNILEWKCDRQRLKPAGLVEN